MMKKLFLTLTVLALTVTVSGCLGTVTEETDVPAGDETEAVGEEMNGAPEGDVEGVDVDEIGDKEAVEEDAISDEAVDATMDGAEEAVDDEEPVDEGVPVDEATE